MSVQPKQTERSLRLARFDSKTASVAVAATRDAKEPRSVPPTVRERDLALLNALVSQIPETGSALLIRGAPGTGKSALVAALVRDVRAQPIAILRASGVRGEANLAYSGLHQLLRPLLNELGSLRRLRRRAIEAAFRMTTAQPPDPFLIAVATLDLLSVAAAPALVVVEDAQWLDRQTSEVLSFVARRLSSDPIVLLVTAADDRRSAICEAGLDELGLDVVDDEQVPPSPAGSVEHAQPHDLARADLVAFRDATTPPDADLSLIDLASGAVDDGDVVLAKRMLWAAAQHVLWESGDPEARLATRKVADRIPARSDDPWLLAIAAALGSADPVAISEAAGQCDQRDVVASDLLLVGISSAIAGDVARSRLLLERAASALRADDDRPLMAQLLVMQAWNDIHLGRWAEAASEIADGAQLAHETQQATWSRLADVAGALVAAMQGDCESGEQALARAASATIGQRGWLASTIEVVRGIADLNAGRIDAAYARLRDRLCLSGDASLWTVDHFADAAVHAGKVDEARAVLAASHDADASGGPLQSAGLLYARALLADDATADQRQAVAIENLAAWPVHQARLQLHRGAWLRRHRRAADSRAPLRAARDLFEAVGAAPLTERARRELRASGERSRKRDLATWDQLSPQESEIAQMAANGLSNRQIGEQLFLSPRTIGSHLYRVFPKLGVTSRGQLHTVLPAGVGG